MRRSSRQIGRITVAACFAFGLTGPLFAAAAERVELEVRESGRAEPIPCRVHLRDAEGNAQRAGTLPFWRDHFVCPGTVRLDLKPGQYSYEIERGPEVRVLAGKFTVTAGADLPLRFELDRIANLAADGWWSGEMHVHRPVEDAELLMRAEDLHVAPVITWWNNRNLWSDREPPQRLLTRFDTDRYAHVMGGEDEREGGALLFFHLPRPLAITGASREYPSPMRFLREARQHEGAWIDIEKPFWWDVPVWLASDQVDSIGLANNHMCRDQMYENEAWGKPRNADALPGPLGNGYWTQEIYYHVLNTGLRIPPSAGSASGVLPNPVGYNRLYAHVDGAFDHENWWKAVRAGRSFVTNGPLLRVRANGEWPGHVFTGAGGELRMSLAIDLVSRDPIRQVEVIRNGSVEQSISGAEWTRSKSLEPIVFRESGWFLVRVLADNPKTFRFASTAPFYVEIGTSKRPVHRASAQFFRDWVDERVGRIKIDDPEQRREVLGYQEQAKDFWERKVAEADAAAK
jgi:hypothetical protein